MSFPGARSVFMAGARGYTALMEEQDPLLTRAVTALQKGDFETSFVLTEALAIDGDPLAQHFLGWHYHKGLGVPMDENKAVFWWQLAAKGGVPEAQQGLGWAYHNGRGIERDLEHAYYWYSRAASGGDQAAREALVEVAPLLSGEQIKRLEELAAAPLTA